MLLRNMAYFIFEYWSLRTRRLALGTRCSSKMFVEGWSGSHSEFMSQKSCSFSKKMVFADATKKLCIVVGLGRGGIGDNLAKKFSAEGYNVAMIARSAIQLSLPNALSYQCDAGDPQQVEQTIAKIIDDTGDRKTIDALMYNAGSGVFKTLENTSYGEFESAWRTGPGGIFLWSKLCTPYMKSGGSIGITGATASWRGMPYTTAFASAKMATRGLAQALARDLGPSKGIHVFHVIIDGVVNLDGRADPEHQTLDPAVIADTYWALSQQPPNAWTHETHLAAQGAFGQMASI
jgi:NAD(P)-dependent dehydrogenase (short-subunit alcohol dehydrogenase family)